MLFVDCIQKINKISFSISESQRSINIITEHWNFQQKTEAEKPPFYYAYSRLLD